MPDFDPYDGREATKVKHLILRRYLQKLAYKWGWYGGTINYVDGFAGPWKSGTEDLADTSPHIAIAELRRAKEGILQRGRSAPIVRCLFIEKDREAYARLEASIANVHDIQVDVRNGEFEHVIAEVVKFEEGGVNPFGFCFIDPTGWTGFGMQAIAPVLKHQPGEVLINFMTKDIKRFIDDPQSVALSAYIDLFGDADYRAAWQGLSGQAKEDEIVSAYCRRVKEVGCFNYVVSTIVLHPTDNRTHFHLIYGTRRVEGLRVFRDIEASVMKDQDNIHVRAQQRKRVERSGRPELWTAAELAGTSHIEQLRARYLQLSKPRVYDAITHARRISYDELEIVALNMPMTWKSDLKDWLREWQSAGLIRYEGLAPRARVPQHDSGHFIVLT
jgi:three-Cys-motif partner protein